MLNGSALKELDFSDVMKVMSEVFGLTREDVFDRMFYDSQVYNRGADYDVHAHQLAP